MLADTTRAATAARRCATHRPRARGPSRDQRPTMATTTIAMPVSHRAGDSWVPLFPKACAARDAEWLGLAALKKSFGWLSARDTEASVRSHLLLAGWTNLPVHDTSDRWMPCRLSRRGLGAESPALVRQVKGSLVHDSRAGRPVNAPNLGLVPLRAESPFCAFSVPVGTMRS